eukprot:UN12943
MVYLVMISYYYGEYSYLLP